MDGPLGACKGADGVVNEASDDDWGTSGGRPPNEVVESARGEGEGALAGSREML